MNTSPTAGICPSESMAQRVKSTDRAARRSPIRDEVNAIVFSGEADADVIVVDLFDAEPSALERVSKLRASAAREVPIVALIAEGDGEFRTRVLRAGATFYLRKPIKPGLLNDFVRGLLGFKNETLNICWDGGNHGILEGSGWLEQPLG